MALALSEVEGLPLPLAELLAVGGATVTVTVCLLRAERVGLAEGLPEALARRAVPETLPEAVREGEGLLLPLPRPLPVEEGEALPVEVALRLACALTVSPLTLAVEVGAREAVAWEDWDLDSVEAAVRVPLARLALLESVGVMLGVVLRVPEALEEGEREGLALALAAEEGEKPAVLVPEALGEGEEVADREGVVEGVTLEEGDRLGVVAGEGEALAQPLALPLPRPAPRLGLLCPVPLPLPLGVRVGLPLPVAAPLRLPLAPGLLLRLPPALEALPLGDTLLVMEEEVVELRLTLAQPLPVPSSPGEVVGDTLALRDRLLSALALAHSVAVALALALLEGGAEGECVAEGEREGERLALALWVAEGEAAGVLEAEAPLALTVEVGLLLWLLLRLL